MNNQQTRDTVRDSSPSRCHIPRSGSADEDGQLSFGNSTLNSPSPPIVMFTLSGFHGRIDGETFTATWSERATTPDGRRHR